jgi:hypothetical protein
MKKCSVICSFVASLTLVLSPNLIHADPNNPSRIQLASTNAASFEGDVAVYTTYGCANYPNTAAQVSYTSDTEALVACVDIYTGETIDAVILYYIP